MTTLEKKLQAFLKENIEDGYGIGYEDMDTLQQEDITLEALEHINSAGFVEFRSKYVKTGGKNKFIADT